MCTLATPPPFAHLDLSLRLVMLYCFTPCLLVRSASFDFISYFSCVVCKWEKASVNVRMWVCECVLGSVPFFFYCFLFVSHFNILFELEWIEMELCFCMSLHIANRNLFVHHFCWNLAIRWWCFFVASTSTACNVRCHNRKCKALCHPHTDTIATV